MMRLSKRLHALILWLQNTGAVIGVLLSIALAGAAVTGSFFVPTKALGVLLAAIGCFAAGWTFAGFFGKAIGLAKREGSSEDALYEANETLQNRIAELEVDASNLRSQRINIDAMYSVLKLGLCEAEMSVKDVRIEWMNDFDDGKVMGIGLTPTRSQYVGVLQRSFKAVYGVDLMKLRICETGDRVLVAGIKLESIGFKDDKSDWLIRQSQQYSLKKIPATMGGQLSALNPIMGFKGNEACYEIDRTKPFKGNLDLNKVDEHCKNQEEALRDRMNNGVGDEFSNINNYIQEIAQGFIRVLLAPVGKEIEFDMTPLGLIKNDTEWKSLEDYVREYNSQLSRLGDPNNRLIQ